MRSLSRIILLCGLLCLAACKSVPTETAQANLCHFAMATLAVAQPDEGQPAPASPGAPGTRPASATVDDSMLLLSGGSLHGAFGAGFLDQWKRQAGGLPRFRYVTGISTGAILSTSAFIGQPEQSVQAYTISAESQLLKAYAHRGADGKFSIGSYLAIARHNSLADLAPLRDRLHQYITFDTLAEVDRQSLGRRLLVGAVDVDTAQAVIFDMTDMARRAVHAESEAQRTLYRDCYINAIVASSSVPLAAKPAFIDNRMYIDGGARFGVFALMARHFAERTSPAGTVASIPTIYILVNGDQEESAQCSKVSCGTNGPDAYDDLLGRHGSWSLPDVALRANDILINQVYRFSVANVALQLDQRFPGQGAASLHFARIDQDEMLKHRFPADGNSCAAWHDIDDRTLRPLQFYPNYMACLIDYGRTHAQQLGWGTQHVLSDAIEK